MLSADSRRIYSSNLRATQNKLIGIILDGSKLSMFPWKRINLQLFRLTHSHAQLLYFRTKFLSQR